MQRPPQIPSASDGAGTSPLLQGSFTSGELAPALYARTDLEKFHSGAKLLRNFFVQAQGGAVNRAGTLFVGYANLGDAPVRLIPFSFNVFQTYILEVGAGYIRFISNGGYVTDDGLATGTPVEVATPYTDADLFNINFAQSADVLTLVHPSYPPAQVVRNSATSWTYTTISIGTKLVPPMLTYCLGISNGRPGGGNSGINYLTNTPFKYALTSVTLSPPDESPLSNSLQCINFDLGYYTYGVYNALFWSPNQTQHVDYYNIYRYFNGTWGLCAATVGALFADGGYSTNGTLALNWNDQDAAPDTNTAPPNNINPFYSFTGTGSISDGTGANSGTVMVVTSYGGGTLSIGDTIAGGGLVPQTNIVGCVSGASFRGSISGTTLTVSQVITGALSAGMEVFGAGVSSGTTITGSNEGTQTFGVSYSQTVASETLYAATDTSALFTGSTNGTTLVVSSGVQPSIGMMLFGTGVPQGTSITDTTSSAGTFLLSTGSTISSETLYAFNGTGGVFAGAIDGTMLTVSTVTSGEPLLGQTLTSASGDLVPNTTIISSQGGAVGNYYLNQASTMATGPFMAWPASSAGATYTVSQVNMSADEAFTGGVQYPGAFAYFQQRAVYGGSNDSPQTIWTSRSGNYNNFNISQPLRDDDAITVTIAANQVNQIRHFVSVNDLIAFTNGGAWKISGQSNSGDVLTPSNVVCTPQAYSGCSNVPPIVVTPQILYVQETGATVRELAYNVYTNLYTGVDISVLAMHLFYGYKIIDWSWAREPWKIVWATRNDGTLLGLTYLKEQDVYAWHHHDTGGTVDSYGNAYAGTFCSVASVLENSQDTIYVAVRRFLNGAWTRTIERMQSRVLGAGNSDITAAWFVDCGLQYSGNPVSRVTGLDHLTGQTVAILADGKVKTSQVVAADGSVTINEPCSVITVGLPIQAQIETLPIDAGSPTIQGKYKRLTKTRIFVDKTRGLKVGPNTENGPMLEEIAARFNEPWGSPPALFTGQQLVHIPGNWDNYGSLWVQQDYPLPATVLGIEPWVSVGE